MLANLPPTCAECLEIWEPQPPGTLRACPGLYSDCFTFTETSYNLHLLLICTGTQKREYYSESSIKCLTLPPSFEFVFLQALQ